MALLLLLLKMSPATSTSLGLKHVPLLLDKMKNLVEVRASSPPLPSLIQIHCCGSGRYIIDAAGSRHRAVSGFVSHLAPPADPDTAVQYSNAVWKDRLCFSLFTSPYTLSRRARQSRAGMHAIRMWVGLGRRHDGVNTIFILDLVS